MRNERYTLEHLIEHYNKHVNKTGHCFKSVQWNSLENQYIRFKYLLENLPPNIQTICDIGCGLGDLYFYIKKNQLQLNYKGIDISGKMIVAAQKAYPKGNFSCLDLESYSKNNQPDCIIASGLFNVKIHNHEKYVKDVIHNMINCAKYEVRFNMLHSNKKIRQNKQNFYYITENKIRDMLTTFSVDITTNSTYLDQDITFIIKK